jgi:hypothetical protein
MSWFVTPRERVFWGSAGALLALIYATLSVVRPATELLRAWQLLIPALILVFGVSAGFALRGLHHRRPGPWEAMMLVGVALAYGALFFAVRTPEEAMHFVEYGLVAVLFHAALAERRRGLELAGRTPIAALRRPAVSALVLTVAAGWLDEGIQHLLPGRYYDLRDVAFNAAAAVLALAAVVGREWARERDGFSMRSSEPG